MISAQFRVLTPDNLVSEDIFVLADRQPHRLRPGCVLLVNEADGSLLIAHQTRLVAVKSPDARHSAGQARSVCLSCGKVEGVAEDEVLCPYDGDEPCRLIRPTLGPHLPK